MAETRVRELHIVIIHTPDLEAARAFYGGVLGMTIETEAPQFISVAPIGGAGATLGVSLGEASATGPEIWWRVDDTDALHAHLVASGVRITEEPKDEPFGRSVSFLDPAGNLLNAFKPR